MPPKRAPDGRGDYDTLQSSKRAPMSNNDSIFFIILFVVLMSGTLGLLFGLPGATHHVATGDRIIIQIINAGNNSSNVNSISRRLLSTVDGVPLTGSPQAHAVGEDLLSLQYYLLGIQLCHNLSSSGSAFNDQEGCVQIYERNSTGYSDYTIADALDDNDTDHWVDVAKASSALGTFELTAEDREREYNFLVVTFMQPIKVQATLRAYDGVSTIRTKLGTVNATTGKMLADTSMLSGDPELAVGSLPNGGAWSKLARPVTIGTGEWTLTLAFNPDGIIKGNVNSQQCDGQICDQHNHTSISLPYLALNPILHRVDDPVYRETYILDVSDPEYQIRHQLYYKASDPTAVLAVDTMVQYSLANDSGKFLPNGISQTFFAETNGTHYDFMTWNRGFIFHEFQRIAEVGQRRTCLMGCFQGSCLGVNEAPSDSNPQLAVEYELTRVDQVA